MAEVTLYSPEEDEGLLEEAEALLETAYLEYDEEVDETLAVPKLEIRRENGKEVYTGKREIKEGLNTTQLEDLDRRF